MNTVDWDKEGAKLRWWIAAEQGFEVAQNNLAYVLDQRKFTLYPISFYAHLTTCWMCAT
jgi:SEL1 protein